MSLGFAYAFSVYEPFVNSSGREGKPRYRFAEAVAVGARGSR
jgi:hypothetical protein